MDVYMDVYNAFSKLVGDDVPPFLVSTGTICEDAALDGPLWTESAEAHLRWWPRGVAALGLTPRDDDVGIVPAGRRGGGATERLMRYRDAASLRRRGRWTQLSTLDRYLHEGVRLQQEVARSDKVRRLAPLAAFLFSQFARHRPRASPRSDGEGRRWGRKPVRGTVFVLLLAPTAPAPADGPPLRSFYWSKNGRF